MGSGEMEDPKSGTPFVGVGTISCSICLETVIDSGDRSTAKLQCGHQFHLDCIGSAFNAKGAMQCPNCRKVEKGQWLFANGYRAFADFGLDEWPHDEDLYDLGYSEIPYGVHWCPFRGFAQLSASFEDADHSASAYHDIFGHHGIFPDHASASSTAHACPYLALHAYVHPIHPTSSSNSDGVTAGPAFHRQWANTGPADISAQGFPGSEVYHSWEQHSPPFSPPNSLIHNCDQSSTPAASRPLRTSFDSDGLARFGAFVPPFIFSHRSSRAGIISSGMPPYIVNSRGHARLHAYQQQVSPAMRSAFPMPARRSGPRSVASNSTSHLGTPTAATPSDHNGFYANAPPASSSGRNQQDGESSGSRHHGWERERFAPFPWVPIDGESQWWSPFQHGQAPARSTAGGSDTVVHRSIHWVSGATGSDSVSRSHWWPAYSSTDRANQGQPSANGVSSDSLHTSGGLWQLYVERGGHGLTQSSYQHHLRLPRMPPFM